MAAAASWNATDVAPAPGVAVDGHHRAPLDRAARQQLAHRAGHGKDPLAGQHHGPGAPGGTVEELAGLLVPPGKRRQGHDPTLANVCSTLPGASVIA